MAEPRPSEIPVWAGRGASGCTSSAAKLIYLATHFQSGYQESFSPEQVEVGTGLPPIRQESLAVVLEPSAEKSYDVEIVKQHVYGIAESGVVWRLTRVYSVHALPLFLSRARFLCVRARECVFHLCSPEQVKSEGMK